jgi:hypothetical protein
MHNSMAVWAEGPEVLYWVDLIHLTDLGKLLQMMDVNQGSSRQPILCLKLKSANGASCPEMIEALFPGMGIPLVTVDEGTI